MIRIGVQRKTLVAGLWLILAGVIVQSYLSLAPLAHAWRPDELDLAGQWEICQPKTASTSHCAWAAITAPSKLNATRRSRLPGWIVYRRHFTSPQNCFRSSAACALVIGEVGDAVEARLNGIDIGRHGDFPPHPRYARHYPAKFDVSRDILRHGNNANSLELLVYANKKVQAGIGNGPLGIFSSGQGFLISKLLVTLNVILPIVGFVALFFMGLIPALAGLVARQRDGRLDAFIGFCFAASFFLLSFSEIPREWLPIWIAGYMHFLTRIVFDWTYFEMVQTYYALGNRWKRLARPGYLAIMTAFCAMLFIDGLRNGGKESGFDTAYIIMRIAFPLLILPHVAGLIGAWRERAVFTGRVFMPFFALTLVMQIHDCLIFHGFMAGTYAVKVYPVFIGAAFGWLMLQRYHQERERLAVAEGIAEVTSQVAHDLQAPLTALSAVARRSESLAHEDRTMLEAGIERLGEISRELLDRYRTEAPTDLAIALTRKPEIEVIDVEAVSRIAALIVAEKRLTYRTRKQLLIDFHSPSEYRDAQVGVNSAQLKRALSNLLNNAVEAAGAAGTVTVAVGVRAKEAFVAVHDTGCGMPSDLLQMIGTRGLSRGKADGHGFGLHHAKTCAERWGGSLRISSSAGGTVAELTMPLFQESLWKELKVGGSQHELL